MNEIHGPNNADAFITSKDTLDGAYPGLILGINARRLGKDFIDGVIIQTAEDFLKYSKDCKILLYT